MEETYTADEKRKEKFFPNKEEETSGKIRRILPEDKEFPKRFEGYANMPKELYVKGRLPREDALSIAIVGARMCSVYGRAQAFRYARELSRAGVQVISGLAYGIDAEAHKGALEGGTPTFSVLGSGVDVCYPVRNRFLYERILRKRGGILSEYPPGTPPASFHFPIRNRIISALSDGVLVVEAKEKSGSLITAQYALEQGKAVYAVPGGVQEDLSRGCHRLIYDGAGIAYTPEILLEELGISVKKEKKTSEKTKIGLASDLKLVYSCLDLRPKGLEILIEETGFPPERINAALMELEIMGLIKEAGRHYYVKDGTAD